MEKEKLYSEYLDLIDKITEAQKKYYYDTPIMTDQEYDALFHRLLDIEENHKELINENSPSQRVGVSIESSLPQIEHKKRKYSLEDVFSFEEVKEWKNKISRADERARDVDLTAELKIDGLNLTIIYKKGILEKAITRGDGYVGEDVTQNAKMIIDIPIRLNKEIDCTVSGEVYLPKNRLADINKKRAEENKTLFANCRNVASGTMRTLDPNVVKERGLRFFAYDIDID